MEAHQLLPAVRSRRVTPRVEILRSLVAMVAVACVAAASAQSPSSTQKDATPPIVPEYEAPPIVEPVSYTHLTLPTIYSV